MGVWPPHTSEKKLDIMCHIQHALQHVYDNVTLKHHFFKTKHSKMEPVTINCIQL